MLEQKTKYVRKAENELFPMAYRNRKSNHAFEISIVFGPNSAWSSKWVTHLDLFFGALFRKTVSQQLFVGF